MGLAIGPWQVLIVLLVVLIFPIGLFVLAYFIGKKAGYNKALKEKNLTSEEKI